MKGFATSFFDAHRRVPVANDEFRQAVLTYARTNRTDRASDWDMSALTAWAIIAR
jgi:hypothetical protein